MTTTSRDDDPRQVVLAAEHAAVHLYGVLAARTSESTQTALWSLLREAWVAHRDRRDDLSAGLLRAGVEPAPAAPGYRVPPLGSEAAIRRAAAEIERACTTAYADMVAHTSGDRRAWAVTALAEAAGRETEFGGDPGHFPGLVEFDS